jgi:hypothetical protein
MSDQKIRPGRLMYLLAAVMFAGAVAAIVWAVPKLVGGIGEMAGEQIVVPGKTEVTLDKPGNYTLSHEYQSVVNGKRYSTRGAISDLECTLRSRATGREVPLSPIGYSSTYNIGARAGVGIYSFTIDRAGTYELDARYPEGTTGPEAVLSIGRFSGMMRGMAGFGLGLVLAFFLFIGSAAIFVVTLVLRITRKRKAAASPYAMPPPGSI